MRLQELTITNFGIYKGKNIFDFPYSEDKKVTIVIGKNGSGKTTFLNSMKVCLFGSMLLKNRTITKGYIEMIMNKLNKEALKNEESEFSIRAKFTSQVHNYDGEFIIKRSWSVKPSFTEEVYMERNGKALDEYERETFLNAFYHAFPLDLFELFYLDGEKIDGLSILDNNVFELFESAINVDLFKRLKGDLLTYATKRVNDVELDNMNERKIELQNSLMELKKSLAETEQKNDYDMENFQMKNEEIINLKNSINFQHNNHVAVDLDILKQEIDEFKKSIETDLTKFLPYTIVKGELNQLLKDIQSENNMGNNTIINSALSSNELLEHLKTKFSSEEIFGDILRVICDFYPEHKYETTHKLSDDDFYSLKNKINDMLKFDKAKLQVKVEKLEKLEIEKSNKLKNIEDMEAARASGEIEKLLELQKESDSYHVSIVNGEKEIEELREKIEAQEKELKNIESQLWNGIKKNNITNVLVSIQNVLEKYIEKIKENKIKDIEIFTKDMFDRLIRKSEFIERFKFDQDKIYFLDKNDNVMDPNNLSAGEKQLCILSIIHALLRSSERNVPLMFDTLLGRLDEEHRNNVFKEFISTCPDQVIVLATDSELANIDPKYLDAMTNKKFIIDFSKSSDKILEVS